MNLRRLLMVILILLLTRVGIAQNLKIVAFDIGQGAATLIWSPTGETMLVDAGSALEPDDIRLYLQAQGITDLTYTVATHYHADHIGEFEDLFLSGYLPNIAYDRGDNPGYTTATYYDYIAAAAPVRQTITPGQVIDMGGGVEVTTVCVNGQLMNGASYSLNDENERSICLLIEYRNFRFVVSGDLGGGSLGLFDLETPCSNLIGDVNVFQLNHHGSNSSTNANWLNNLDAEAGIVSLGNSNPYGFVHTEVVSRVNGNPTLQALYHTEQGYNLSTKSVVVNDNILLETDGLTCYTVAGDTFDLGGLDVYLQVWVDPSTVEPIPASGGMLYYDIFAQNLEGTAVPVHAKFYLQVPSYGPYTLIDLPNYSLPPLPVGTTRLKNANIPAGAPAGMYQIIGEFLEPGTEILYATDRDTFYKAGVENFGAEGNWDLAGLNSPAEGPDLLFPVERTPDEKMVESALSLRVFPTPFNAEVQLSFELSRAVEVQLEIFDIAGHQVRQIFHGELGSGRQTFTWQAEEFPAGIYVARLMGANLAPQMQKLVLVK